MRAKNSIIFAFVALFIFSSCKGKNANNDAENIKTLPVYSVIQVDTIVSNTFVADIQARKNIEIHARIAGLMESVFVNEGQAVKKGQVLFKLSDAELQIELLKAQATLKTAEADMRMAGVEVKQLQALFDKKIIANNELEMAKAKFEAAEAKVAYAHAEKNAILQQISFTTIVAPFDGIIDRIPLKEGSLIQNGSLLTTVSELDEIYAYFSIPENNYFQMMESNSINTQKSISLILPSGTKYDQEGTLETAEGEIDKQTGSIQFKAKFKNPSGLIKHGTSGKLIISDEKHDALLIPQKSVFSIQDKRYVFIVNSKGYAHMRTVSIEGALEDYFIVKEGLKANDVIVREGTQSLRDGEKIKMRKSK